MSNAIAQSTNQIAISPLEESQFPWEEVLERLGRTASQRMSSTRYKGNLSQQALRDMLKREYVSTYPSLYPKGNLPSDVWDKVCHHVDQHIKRKLSVVHTGNTVSVTDKFRYNSRNMSVVMRHTIIGEDTLILKHQYFGVCCLIHESEKRLLKLETANPVDMDMVNSAKKRLAELNEGKTFIQREIVHQQSLLKAAKVTPIGGK